MWNWSRTLVFLRSAEVHPHSPNQWGNLPLQPIVSPCDNGLGPEVRLRPPGDCEWSVFLALEKNEKLFCSVFTQLPCAPGDTKAACAIKATNISDCLVARIAR